MDTSSMAVGPRLSNFLSLAPNLSDSYPREPKPTKAAAQETGVAATATATADDASGAAKRRTSSLGSDGSKTRRFLKLGPVHWGEHQDEHHKGDWHEVEVAVE